MGHYKIQQRQSLQRTVHSYSTTWKVFHFNTIGYSAFAASQNPGRRLPGIIGFGEVGLASAKRALGLGMSIHHQSRSGKPAAVEDTLNCAAYHPDLVSMLKVADSVLLACPYAPATHHIMDQQAFSSMKRGSRLVNVAWGRCVDEEAPVTAIEKRVVVGAGLDVFHDE